MSNQNYGPNPFQAPAPQPAPKKQKRFGFLALGIATASALIVGSCTGALAGGGDSTTTAEPAPTVTVTAPAEPGSTVTVTAKPEPAPTVTVTAKPKEAEQEEAEPEEPVLGDGLWEVGVDIKAGRYKTTVPADSYNCYVARHKDDSGELESIIANENYEPGARVSVKVKKGEWLELKGCGDAWKRVK